MQIVNRRVLVIRHLSVATGCGVCPVALIIHNRSVHVKIYSTSHRKTRQTGPSNSITTQDDYLGKVTDMHN